MIYDTAGNIIQELIQNCDCELTGGCEKCNPNLKFEMFELEKDQQKLKNWKERFNKSFEKKHKELFPNKTLKEVIYIYEDGSKWRMLHVPNYIENSKTLDALVVARRSYIQMKPVEWERINSQLKL